MNRGYIVSFGILVSLLTLSGVALGWWDTQILIDYTPPTIETVLAQDCPDIDERFIVEDDSARGGAAVLLIPGGAVISFERELEVSNYFLQLICRSPNEDFIKPSPPVILQLRVTNLDTGEETESRARIAFTKKWQDGARLYFPVYEPGRYRIEVFSGPRSVDEILIDFIELKDIFAELPRVGLKSGRYLHTPEHVENLRRLPDSRELAARLIEALPDLEADQAREWRSDIFEAMWLARPPRNLHYSRGGVPASEWRNRTLEAADGIETWQLEPGWGPWRFVHPATDEVYTYENWLRGEIAGDVAFPDDGTGFHASRQQTGLDDPVDFNWMGAALMARYRSLHRHAEQRADEYLRTGNERAGWEGVCALIAFADMYPDIDQKTQAFRFDGTQFGISTTDLGKFAGAHNTKWVVRVFRAYDALYPIIHENEELAAVMGEFVPWIETPRDVVKFLDTNLLQHYADAVDRLVCRAPEGESEAVMSVAAVVQGPNEAGDWMWEKIFTRNYWRMQHKGGLQDHLHSTIGRDGVTQDVGSAEYTKASAGALAKLYQSAKRYMEIGGDLRFDITDLDAFPKMLQSPYYPLYRKAAGVWTPRIGDWGTAMDPPQHNEQAFFGYARQTYQFGWETHRDPRFAWFLRDFGRLAESDEEWAEIEAAAERQGVNPFMTTRSRNLPGFGMTILEAHPGQTDYHRKSAAVIRTGVGLNHGHCDQLNLIFYGVGNRLVPDMGRRYRAPAWNNGMHAGLPGGLANYDWWDETPGGRTSRVHNLVEVDDKDFLNVAYNRSGVGWTESLYEMQGVSYSRSSAFAESHDHLDTYTRDVALVPVGDNAYLFDVFRVAGGRVHTMASGGPVNTEPEQVSFNTPMSDEHGEILDRYPGPGFFELLHGVSPSVLQITWRIAPTAVQRYMGPMAEYPSVFVRAWRPGVEGLPVMRGWTRVRDWTGSGTPHNFVFVRRESDEDIEGAYTTITEGYWEGDPLVANVELLATGIEDGAMAPRAVRVELANGRTDFIYAGGDGQALVELPGGMSVRGEFALVSRGADGRIERATLMGGDYLQVDGMTLQPANARWGGVVTEVDIINNTVTLDRPLPSRGLEGATFHVRREAAHDASYIVDRVEGNVLHLRGSMKAYQSAVTEFDAETGGVKAELPPPLLEALPIYYDGLSLFNGRGEMLGRTKVEFGERWMYLGFPPHTQWRQRISMDEIVDADGDGRRTLRMYAVHPIKRWLGDGEMEVIPAGGHMCDLEVTRVSDDGLMIWFKDPPERFTYTYDIPHGSWFYQGMRMVTEDGARELIANYPGIEYSISVPERELGAGDLPEEEDGRRLVIIGDIGPGDIFDAPAYVSLVRTEHGWLIDANCQVEVRLAE